jgi:hypothetical protein
LRGLRWRHHSVARRRKGGRVHARRDAGDAGGIDAASLRNRTHSSHRSTARWRNDTDRAAAICATNAAASGDTSRHSNDAQHSGFHRTRAACVGRDAECACTSVREHATGLRSFFSHTGTSAASGISATSPREPDTCGRVTGGDDPGAPCNPAALRASAGSYVSIPDAGAPEHGAAADRSAWVGDADTCDAAALNRGSVPRCDSADGASADGSAAHDAAADGTPADDAAAERGRQLSGNASATDGAATTSRFATTGNAATRDVTDAAVGGSASDQSLSRERSERQGEASGAGARIRSGVVFSAEEG